MSRNESRAPIRRILFRFESGRAWDRLDHAAAIARHERATLDICALVRRHSALLFLALIGGVPVMPAQLEAEELDELAEEMRQAVAGLPPDVGVRSFLMVGNPRRRMAELMAASDYDLIL